MAAFVSDDFNGTANVDLTTRGWTAVVGRIFTDTATGTKATMVDGACTYTLTSVAPPTADYAVRATIDMANVSGTLMGVRARAVSGPTNTGYLARVGVTTKSFQLYRVVSGSSTLLVEAGTGLGAVGLTQLELRVTTNGAQVDLELWWGGVLALSYSDTSAFRLLDAGYPGIGSSGGTRNLSYWDNFEAEVIGAPAAAELDGDATASAAASGALDTAILLDADATASATAAGALAATAPTVAITSFSASGADLVIGYTHTSVGSSPLLTASLSRDGTPIADVTTSTLSGTFTITGPGPGVYTLTLLTLADSEGTDTDGPWGSTVTILGAAAHLEGDADAAVNASGALTTGIPLAGAAIISTAATGDLSTAVQLAAAAIASGQATGELAGAITLQGAAVTATLASGELTAQIRLDGAALAAAIASAGLTTEILLAAAAQAGAQATGALTTGEGLEGAATASAQAAGSLTTLIVLSGAAVSALLASGALTTAPSGLAGDATAGATAAGALTTQIPLSGGAQVSVIASGAATTSITLAGAAVAVVGATGDLVVALGLSASALASAIAGADLTTAVVLRADAVVGAQAGGVLSGFVYVASQRRTYMARRRVRKAIAGIT